MSVAAEIRRRVLMGLMFFPRGGSAQVVRSLASVLPHTGWDVTVVSGSLGDPGAFGNAHTFFAGLEATVVPMNFTRALVAADPLRADPPLHPSYEDRLGAPDRVFAAVDSPTYAHQVTKWSRMLRTARAVEADVLHLHHLTPLHAAAARVAPNVPVVGHLHGTELLMLDAIAHGPPVSWPHAAAWAQRMRSWAQACQLLIVPSTTLLPHVQALLDIAPARCLHLPNGFDPQRFTRRRVDRLKLWQRLLVEQPSGWSPGSAPGSVAYTVDQLQPFHEAPVLLFVGRFTALKCLSVLIAAYVRACAAFTVPAPLVLLGGFPGEWEGEHPLEIVQRLGAHNVFLAGWYGHDALPDIYAASDVVILPSAREPFGQVLVEGMACGLPAIAVAAGGPSEIVADGQTGWLVPPDNEAALAAALVQAVNDPTERVRRGVRACKAIHTRYSWPRLGAQLAGVYETLGGSRPARSVATHWARSAFPPTRVLSPKEIGL
jgi:glycosyltransferase involved in cell wall biosynthesis